jgi:hypothetical protein
MSEPHGRQPSNRGRGRPRSESRSARAPGLRPLGDGAFELVHPPCVEELWPDFEEAMHALAEGAVAEARDQLRFLLEECGTNLWVHAALGRIALESHRDARLARGHFGYAFELARRAVPPDFRGRLPGDRPANRPLYDALDGLIACDEALGRRAEADELRVLRRRWQG